MNIIHLKYAVEVEKTGSITKAADHLFMGQPNLSKAIRELEKSIGITIFKRTSKGVVPTREGKEFLSYAKSILMQIEQVESLYKPNDEQKICFSISVPRASYITYAFTRFMQTIDLNQSIKMNFKETNSMEAIGNILEYDYHLGIIRYPVVYEKYFLKLLADKELSAKTIWEFEYLILLSREHPLVQKETLSLEDLNPYIELVHGDLTIPHLGENHTKKELPVEHTQKHILLYERGSQFDLLHEVPSTYMWVSPLPEELLERYGLIQRRCHLKEHKNKDVLIHPRHYKLSEVEESFLSSLNQVKTNIVEIFDKIH